MKIQKDEDNPHGYPHPSLIQFIDKRQREGASFVLTVVKHWLIINLIKHSIMKKLSLAFFLILLIPSLAFSGTGPTGWASVNANGQNGTTGGAGGETVTVNNMTDLITYAGSTASYIIQIEGPIKITPKGRHINVRSNKTIIGITTDAGLVEGGFTVGSNQKNIIFRNLTISDTYLEGDWDGKDQDWDGIQIKGTCHHIWIDRCTFLRQGDGAVDITNGASYITISYTIFGQNNKASLIGSSDTDSHTDKYKVTIHHSWFNETTQRHPRVRFGQVHLFNNYYYNMGGYGREMNYANSNGYGIGVGVSAQIVSEKNYFERVVYPSQMYDSHDKPGYISDNGSFFVSSGQMITRPDGINWNPADHYDYTLDDAETVKEKVMAQAGAGHDLSTFQENIYADIRKPGLKVFPNPVTDKANLVLEVPEPGIVFVTLKDITGRVVREISREHYFQGQHSLSFNRNGIRSGIYLISVESNNRSVTRKIVIN
jgi:pectate lyase